LNSLDKAGTYNFEYAGMVVSRNTYASQWMNGRYNLYWVPTLYWDGGDEVLVGGYSDTSVYSWRINLAGQREVPELDLQVSMTWLGNYQMEVTVTVTNNHFVNTAPDSPATPEGPLSGLLEDEHTYSTSATDVDGDDLYYKWKWGTEGESDWQGPFTSGEVVYMGHTFGTTGGHTPEVKVKDIWDYETGWAPAAAPTNIVERGDANSDYEVHIADAVYMINFVFKFGPSPDPIEAGDANCDGGSNVADAVYLINYVFNSGPPPVCP
jgi:hypothetical protein